MSDKIPKRNLIFWTREMRPGDGGWVSVKAIQASPTRDLYLTLETLVYGSIAVATADSGETLFCYIYMTKKGKLGISVDSTLGIFVIPDDDALESYRKFDKVEIAD